MVPMPIPAPGSSQGPALDVVGHGFVIKPADRATITLAINTQGTTVESALGAARVAMATVRRETERVRGVRIETSSLSVNTGYGYPQSATTTYNVQGNADIAVDDLSLLPLAKKAMDGIVGVQSSQIRYDVRARDEANAEALAAATADARAQVDALAAKSGLKILGVRSLQAYVNNASSADAMSVRFEATATANYNIAPGS